MTQLPSNLNIYVSELIFHIIINYDTQVKFSDKICKIVFISFLM